MPQGVASVLIGLVLIRISLRLVKRSHDFLVGVWVLTPTPQDGEADGLTQPIRPVEAERVRAFLSAYPGVTGIRELLVTFIGPGRAWIVARVDIDDDLRGAQVKSLVRGIESGMRDESESIYRVDIVPTGRGHVRSRGSRSTGHPGANRVGRKVLLGVANPTSELPLPLPRSPDGSAGSLLAERGNIEPRPALPPAQYLEPLVSESQKRGKWASGRLHSFFCVALAARALRRRGDHSGS